MPPAIDAQTLFGQVSMDQRAPMEMPYARVFEGTGWLPQMHSSSQNFEDVTLRRALLDIKAGFYVDIGGYHPNEHSVTRHFYDSGWNGINVEPNPELLKKFEEYRPRDINLEVVIGKTGGTIDLHVIGDTGLTTAVHDYAVAQAGLGHGTTAILPVTMITLDELFTQYCQGKIVDFLKVDVEGAEADVLTPYTFEAVRPRVIVVENAEGYHQHLINCDYIFCWFDGLNRWYVRKEDDWRCDLLARPVSLWDSVSNAPNGVR